MFMYMSMGPGEGFLEGVMSLGICSMGGIQVFQLVIGFRSSQSLSHPVNGGVCDTKLGESKDDILQVTAYDVTEVFLSNPFDVCVKGINVIDSICFIYGLVHVLDNNGGSKFFSRELVFSDKLPVDARDVNTRVY